MPVTAMIRNLATMTRVGVLAPGSAGAKTVVARLGDAERIRRARVHPIAVLAGLGTYASGRGVRGRNVWSPVQEIVDARLVVVGMVANKFSIADSADPGMLDVVGFDTATPQLISDFARGSL